MGHQDLRQISPCRPHLLVTSFTTWKPHQCSNSSDDLLAAVQSDYDNVDRLRFLRRLPVDFDHAHHHVIQAIQAYRPDAVICCGMGETRSHLCVEDRAHSPCTTQHTTLKPLDWLVDNLSRTRISQDAGQFVCNHVYFEVLRYLVQSSLAQAVKGNTDAPIPCIFVHVPILTQDNYREITSDFFTILDRILALVPYPHALPHLLEDTRISA